jgi:hypothetical protein
MFAGHAYGRIQGRGNRYSHIHNDIMLDYMVQEQLKFDRRDVREMNRLELEMELAELESGRKKPRPYEFKPHSLTTLRNVVRERIKSKAKGIKSKSKYKGSWDTIISHGDDLVKAHILTKETKAGSNNETYYRLTSTKFKDRVEFPVRR